MEAKKVTLKEELNRLQKYYTSVIELTEGIGKKTVEDLCKLKIYKSCLNDIERLIKLNNYQYGNKEQNTN